jgi:hypothetical protein
MLPGIAREIGQVLFYHCLFLRVVDRFQIFLELSRFCIRLALHFIDLRQQKVRPGLAVGLIESPLPSTRSSLPQRADAFQGMRQRHRNKLGDC